jgi:hypothetical protein
MLDDVATITQTYLANNGIIHQLSSVLIVPGAEYAPINATAVPTTTSIVAPMGTLSSSPAPIASPPTTSLPVFISPSNAFQPISSSGGTSIGVLVGGIVGAFVFGGLVVLSVVIYLKKSPTALSGNAASTNMTRSGGAAHGSDDLNTVNVNRIEPQPTAAVAATNLTSARVTSPPQVPNVVVNYQDQVRSVVENQTPSQPGQNAVSNPTPMNVPSSSSSSSSPRPPYTVNYKDQARSVMGPSRQQITMVDGVPVQSSIIPFAIATEINHSTDGSSPNQPRATALPNQDNDFEA